MTVKRPDLVVALTLVLLYGLGAWYLAPYRIDDAYITFRYVANLTEGYGYVYNPGEWVEGASNLLWALVLVPFYGLPASLPKVAAGLGALFYAGLLVYYVRFLEGLQDASWLDVGLSVALPLVAVPVAPLWSVSGLEVSLYLLLLSIGLLTGAPVALLLAALTRPEGVAFLVVLPLLRRSVPLKRYGSALSAWVGVGLLRLGLYGSPLPHSVTAKSGPVFESVLNGLRYLQFGVINHLGLILTVGGLAGLFWLSDRYLTLRGLACFILQVLVVCLAGGDWMPYSRLLLPVLPVFVLGWYGLTESRYRKVAVVVMGGLILLHAGFYPRVKTYTRHLTESVRDNVKVMNRIKESLPENVPRRMALADLGAFGWAARDWTVIDRVGLVTPAIGGQGQGLYRNYSPDYVLDQEPTLIQTHLSDDVPVEKPNENEDIGWLTIKATKNKLAGYATWPGGEALYRNERFRNHYRIYRAFRTPGNPLNVFWVRKEHLPKIHIARQKIRPTPPEPPSVTLIEAYQKH